MHSDDPRFMSRALELAARGLYSADPNPRVGCVLVQAGEIVGEGWHARAGEAHAEVNALRAAGERARGATVYVTLEPCCHHGRTGPCTEALLAAGVSRVVAATIDPDPRTAGSGLEALRARGVEVSSGVLEDQARALNVGFLTRHTRGRPFVRIKMAASLDGRTAMADGESKWITGPAARRDAQHLRARSSAIVTGIGTVLADDPALTVRDVAPEDGGPVRQPLRVVLDRRLRTPADASLLHQPGATLIATSSRDAASRRRLADAGAEILTLADDGRAGLEALMTSLAARECNEVLVEAGATLAGAVLEAGLADEIVVYTAPLLLGDSGRGLFHLPGIRRLAQGLALDVVDVQPVGRDWRTTARVRSR
ncbi:MAG: bifunctional diaminohydroxyphosphoribosylaminopyrimidine deaminase/5-amino-6-(5-phosphoribosylamino)uracil reductase RibD [Gammaproteobacteria bacterium]|nr:bifunctional diaminohydroxyphosphoribosylaminopyrimidine deaminase/5-amino-6-(5-phosphoribosylamino)uracil reductase RibD [Gammaproteobacteria bacterium]NIM73537.1 bifunctional diaminohydroxyphosphoribosylaminopyrimidine deaminase/5-amino-6-(5-phosphoribosylamino)uracil reductase RibD [Gammaproteobacteria bacterium]NIN39946.1 bifunctional diaminohydroxyphosphoribosylaminopyrimidine deaminase/5-amino-6-(5-phosphoribosylamino)uracil reductase RibD [Gammaproteobacteria bacterium]NIO25346.1 bifun